MVITCTCDVIIIKIILESPHILYVAFTSLANMHLKYASTYVPTIENQLRIFLPASLNCIFMLRNVHLHILSVRNFKFQAIAKRLSHYLGI